MHFELCEDTFHVGLNGFLRHAQSLSYLLIPHPFGYEFEYLDLARRNRGHVAQPRDPLGRGNHRRFSLLVNLPHDSNQVVRQRILE